VSCIIICTVIDRHIIDKTMVLCYIDYIVIFSQKKVSCLPKSYSEQERAYIKQRLKEEAAACMGQYGIRRTTVDEIVKRVNIPKGTFYLFYKSKELLLFDVIMEQHEFINHAFYREVSDFVGSDFSAEKLTEVIFRFFKMTEDLPILKQLNSREIEFLVRKLPEDIVAEHFGNDIDMIGEILAMVPVKKDVDTTVISAAFHAIYFSTLHKAEIGEEQYDKALRTLIAGVVTQII